LNAIDGQEQALVRLHLLFPSGIFSDFGSGPQQGAVRFKQIEDFSAADRLSAFGQIRLQSLVDLINRLMLLQAQLPDP
jgi:hypothetical protein